jgi:hypothetical protein
MKGTVDRVEVGEVLTVREAGAISEAVAAPEVVASEPEPWWARWLAARRTRQFDDIPSVVRAMLVGYDEV